MKKLIVLLMIPFFIIGQVTGITFDDLKKIGNDNEFLKLVIDKGFTKVESTPIGESGPINIIYAKHYYKEKNTAAAWAEWYKTSWTFEFVLGEMGDRFSYFDYESIIKSIQSNCQLCSIIQEKDKDILVYKCAQSKMNRITYHIFDGVGIIKGFNMSRDNCFY